MPNNTADAFQTPVFLSASLQRFAQKLVTVALPDQISLLDNWNATIFNVNRKKCWLFTNAQTSFSVILTDVRSADLESIQTLFFTAFCNQLEFEIIPFHGQKICKQIGSLTFHRTNNDRRTIGFQNTRLQTLAHWKNQYHDLENMNMAEFARRLNDTPIFLGVSRKMNDSTTPNKEMRELLRVLKSDEIE
jgi:hypothetical protein